MIFCGSQGFAGESACVLANGHQGEHRYGNFASAVAVDRDRDAARYRWLRECVYLENCRLALIEETDPKTAADFDAAIDAAMTPNTKRQEINQQVINV